MMDVQPVVLEGRGIRLEPLTEQHTDALAAAAADGRLWELWFTAVPTPDQMRVYVADALKGQRDGHMRDVQHSSQRVAGYPASSRVAIEPAQRRAMIRSRLGYVSLFIVAACGSTEPNVPTYVVGYTLTTTSTLRCDSVKYETADGSIVRVVSPALPWSASFAAPAGSYIEASAWVVASAGGQSGKLKMSWTISGVSSASDSSIGTSSAAGKFMLSVARRQL
jgi:hypothetical protein